MPVSFDHRQGNTLALTFDVTENNVAVNVATWTISCRVTDKYETFTTDLTVTKDAVLTNRFVVRATAAVVDTWPASTVEGHIKCVIGTDTLYSQTFELNIMPKIA